MTILDEIIARKRQDLRARMEAAPRAQLERQVQPSDRDFAAALRKPGLSLIAEIKKKSPSRGVLRADFDVAAIARTYETGASCISVLCDEPYFGGSLANLGIARAACTKPLLAKDFLVDPYQVLEARAAGADAVLLIAAALTPAEIETALGLARGLRMAALVEVHSQDELRGVLEHTSAEIVGVNSRDLKTMKIDEEVIFRLLPAIRVAGKVAVAESGVSQRAQVERLSPVADAVLIGSAFMEVPDIGAKLRELGW